MKNRPITTTVVITTIVYFDNSLPFGQLVFLISAPTSRRKFVILLILAIPPNKSYNLSISLLITFAYAMYARCNANKTFLTQDELDFPLLQVKCSFLSHIFHILKQLSSPCISPFRQFVFTRLTPKIVGVNKGTISDLTFHHILNVSLIYALHVAERCLSISHAGSIALKFHNMIVLLNILLKLVALAR